MITSTWAHAGFEVTKQSAGLGEDQSVTLEYSTTFNLGGKTLNEGDIIPPMTLSTSTLDKVKTQGSGKVRIYNVLVSVDTPVCVEQALAFDQMAKENGADGKIEFINVSADTPFAQARFVADQKLSQEASFLSDSAKHEFGQQTGAHIEELGLLSRAVIVVGKDDRILFIQRVPELTQLPDLKAALDIANHNI
nr:redoxin family protein [Vibrio hepatarius]